MITENLTAEQRLQILRELMENPSQEEANLINGYQEKFDDVAAAKLAAQRRNDPTRRSPGVIGKKLI